jgi:hypothetical protein
LLTVKFRLCRVRVPGTLFKDRAFEEVGGQTAKWPNPSSEGQSDQRAAFRAARGVPTAGNEKPGLALRLARPQRYGLQFHAAEDAATAKQGSPLSRFHRDSAIGYGPAHARA